MNKLISIITNRIFISIIGLIVLSILIWFVGPYIKFGTGNYAPLGSEIARLVTIMIVVVLWGLNNLRIQFQGKKNNEKLVTDLQEEQGGVSNIVSDQTSEEMHQIRERFTHALSTLKKLKFKGRGVKKALYELPWYIIIGPPGSGKTTALINSSLDFPLAEKFGKGSLQGVGGTRNCDWWFTNEAVLIDTAGRYTTQDSHRVIDSTAWEGFLGMLKRHRRRRPINGAIIAISLQDLLTQTEDERLKHARTIRARIDELMEKLEIRFPIYLMFTKCDLVSGFSEFFEDLNKDDREQVWGVSLPNAPKLSQSPDFDYLDNEIDELIKRIYDRVLWRIHQERDVKRRTLIQGFPQQMENLKSIVDDFVKKTFMKNRYRLQPYLRGVYFSSGTQDGTPIDRLMSAVSSNFGFSREMVQSGYQQGKSYFLGQLFKQVIFPESELVGSNRKYETFIKWTQRSAYIAMAGVAGIMFLVWGGSYTQHELFMHEVESYVSEYNAEKKRLNKWSSDVRVALPLLNALAKASVVYDQEQHPWLSSLGMYDSNVDDAADKAYTAQLINLYLPRLVQYMELYLKRGHRGGDLYNTFRTYVMFNKLQHMDKQLVIDWFISHWEQELQGFGTNRKELQQHLVNLLNQELQPSSLDKNIVTSTRNLLLRVPVSQRIYGRIRTNPQYTQKIELLNEFGESVRSTYEINPKVEKSLSLPILFTQQGYESVDLSPKSQIISGIVNESWLLESDDQARVDFIKEDLDDISKKVKEHYLSEYRAYWLEVYNNLEVKPFKDLRHANDVLTNFSDPVYSPLLAILQVGANNTQLSNQIAANLADDNQEGAKGKLTSFAASNTPWTVVDKEFRSINVLLRESAKKPAPINQVLQRVRQLQEFVAEMTMSPDPFKKAFEVSKARYQSGAGNAITSLRAYAKTAPKPLNRWLMSLADESWRVILQSAHGHVNSEWRTRVYGPYVQALAGRYPLVSSAQDELAILDFIEFFKPGGTIDTFQQEYVTPFLSTRNGWSNKGVDNYSIGLSQKTLKQIQVAQSIKRVFFRESPEVPSLTFQLRPYHMQKNDARFMLEMGEERIAYSHGPKFWKKIKWTGNDEAHRIRILFEGLNDQQRSKTYEGPWAWFRLLDNSKLTSTPNSNIYHVTYVLDDGLSQDSNANNRLAHSITYEIKAKSINNAFNRNLLGSFRCPERI